jgi:hypothetical protein
LELIENALLVVCLDEPLPASFNCRALRSDVPEAVRGHTVDSRDETNMAHQMIHGGGSAANSANRWFDMTVQVRASLNFKTIIPMKCFRTVLTCKSQVLRKQLPMLICFGAAREIVFAIAGKRISSLFPT